MTGEEDEHPRRWSVGDEVEVDLDGPYVIYRDGGCASVDGDYDCGVFVEADVRPLSLAEVDAAIGAIAEDDASYVDIWLIDTDPPNRVHEVEPMDGVMLYSAGVGEVCALVEFGLPCDFDEEFESQISHLLAPMMTRVGAGAIVPFRGGQGIFSNGELVVAITFASMSGRTVGDLLDVAQGARDLLMTARSGGFTRTAARDLLRARRTSVLIGQAENEWLEAKSQLWDLNTTVGKAEAAKDLSALANASGGLIVIPARTTTEGGRDVIAEMRTLPLDRFSETQLRDTIASRTFPPLSGLEIDVVDCDDGRGFLLIAISPHRAEDWPHLVIGDSQADFPSAAVAAYIRDGDKNRALSAAELHRHMRHSASQSPES